MMSLAIIFVIGFDTSVSYAPLSDEWRAFFYIASLIVLVACAWATAVEKQSARLMPRVEMMRPTRREARVLRRNRKHLNRSLGDRMSR